MIRNFRLTNEPDGLGLSCTAAGLALAGVPLLHETTGEAISAKTLDTLREGYLENPKRIYSKLRGYINAAAHYKPRVKSDLDPNRIRSKTLHVGIPELTPSRQWPYFFRAIIYGKEKDVSVVFTSIDE